VAFPALRLDANGKPFADQFRILTFRLRSESRKCSKKKLQQILVSITAATTTNTSRLNGVGDEDRTPLRLGIPGGRDSPVKQDPV
jgi:hypothetical protein